MKLEIVRLNSQDNVTIGALYDCTNGRQFLCWTLEDEFRFFGHKVMSQTRILVGTYFLSLRKTGGLHQRYKSRFAQIHQGMIEVYEIPGFRDIVLHCGNTHHETAGCILVGNGVSSSHTQPSITGSVNAYNRIYPPIAEAIGQGEEVVCRFTDFDWPAC